MEYRYKLDYSLIANRVKQAREALDITQPELAERIDISTNAVAQLETNRMHPKLQTLLNIANVFQLDINYFLRSSFQDDGDEADETEELLNGWISALSPNEKTFLLHFIEGLKKYNTDA